MDEHVTHMTLTIRVYNMIVHMSRIPNDISQDA